MRGAGQKLTTPCFWSRRISAFQRTPRAFGINENAKGSHHTKPGGEGKGGEVSGFGKLGEAAGSGMAIKRADGAGTDGGVVTDDGGTNEEGAETGKGGAGEVDGTETRGGICEGGDGTSIRSRFR